jgi:hypothetical protein
MAFTHQRAPKSHGQPYEIFAPDSRYVFVSSVKHIKELDTAPDTVLSLQAASKQVRHDCAPALSPSWDD